jgi:two-component system response regulator RegA
VYLAAAAAAWAGATSDEAGSGEEAEAESQEADRRRRRLLLVEDDRATYTALRGILTLRGWDVRVATSVRDGLDAVQDGPYDALVLDLILPDGNGEAVLAELRRRWGDAAPAVVTTGLSDAQRIAAVSQMGVAALLRKPIQLSDLLSGIAGGP